MSLSERRIARRLVPSVSMRIRLRFGTEAGPTVALLDLSERGVGFQTDSPVEKGTAIELTLEMPEESAGGAPMVWCCGGRVVHIRHLSEFAKVVGVQFDHCRILKPSELE